MDIISMLKSFVSKNMKPEEMISQVISENSNPMISNLMQMAKEGNSAGVENFARNLFKEKGRNFDKEFAEFMKQIR